MFKKWNNKLKNKDQIDVLMESFNVWLTPKNQKIIDHVNNMK